MICPFCGCDISEDKWRWEVTISGDEATKVVTCSRQTCSRQAFKESVRLHHVTYYDERGKRKVA